MERPHPIHRLKHRAKLISRTEGIPLHAALDRVAREQGFRTWSLLASRSATATSSGILENLLPGDLVLLAGRPGQGKTVISLELAVETLRRGGNAAFFTLEYTRAQALARVRQLGLDPARFGSRLTIDASDGISAAYLADQLHSAAPGTLVVVDYLQLLDQRRAHAPLSEQVAFLAALARERRLIIVCLSQIDRAFEETGRRLPNAGDVRLPNPVDLSLFSKMCFVHGNRMGFARQ